jgi:hypothetical protein
MWVEGEDIHILFSIIDMYVEKEDIHLLFSGIELFLDHSERSLVSIVDYWLSHLEWDDHHPHYSYYYH